MNHLIEWLAMGGYAPYVWSAYGLVTMVLVLNLFGVRRQKIRTQQQLKHWFKR